MSDIIIAGADTEHGLPLFSHFSAQPFSRLLASPPPSNITAAVKYIIRYIGEKSLNNNHTFHPCFHLSGYEKQYNCKLTFFV